jgi:hypothetical protein
VEVVLLVGVVEFDVFTEGDTIGVTTTEFVCWTGVPLLLLLVLELLFGPFDALDFVPRPFIVKC